MRDAGIAADLEGKDASRHLAGLLRLMPLAVAASDINEFVSSLASLVSSEHAGVRRLVYELLRYADVSATSERVLITVGVQNDLTAPGSDPDLLQAALKLSRSLSLSRSLFDGLCITLRHSDSRVRSCAVTSLARFLLVDAAADLPKDVSREQVASAAMQSLVSEYPGVVVAAWNSFFPSSRTPPLLQSEAVSQLSVLTARVASLSSANRSHCVLPLTSLAVQYAGEAASVRVAETLLLPSLRLPHVALALQVARALHCIAKAFPLLPNHSEWAGRAISALVDLMATVMDASQVSASVAPALAALVRRGSSKPGPDQQSDSAQSLPRPSTTSLDGPSASSAPEHPLIVTPLLAEAAIAALQRVQPAQHWSVIHRLLLVVTWLDRTPVRLRALSAIVKRVILLNVDAARERSTLSASHRAGAAAVSSPLQLFFEHEVVRLHWCSHSDDDVTCLPHDARLLVRDELLAVLVQQMLALTDAHDSELETDAAWRATLLDVVERVVPALSWRLATTQPHHGALQLLALACDLPALPGDAQAFVVQRCQGILADLLNDLTPDASPYLCAVDLVATRCLLLLAQYLDIEAVPVARRLLDLLHRRCSMSDHYARKAARVLAVEQAGEWSAAGADLPVVMTLSEHAILLQALVFVALRGPVLLHSDVERAVKALPSLSPVSDDNARRVLAQLRLLADTATSDGLDQATLAATDWAPIYADAEGLWTPLTADAVLMNALAGERSDVATDSDDIDCGDGGKVDDAGGDDVGVGDVCDDGDAQTREFVQVSGSSDAIQIEMTHHVDPDTHLVHLLVRLVNLSPDVIADAYIHVGVCGELAFDQLRTHVSARLSALRPMMCETWSCELSVLAFDRNVVHARVEFPRSCGSQRRPSTATANGNGIAADAAGAGVDDVDAAAESQLNVELTLLPYSLPLSQFLMPLPYSIADFQRSWSRCTGNMVCLASASSAMPRVLRDLCAVPVLHVVAQRVYCGGAYAQILAASQTWFGDRIQIVFVVASAVVRIHVRAANERVADVFRRQLPTWLPSLHATLVESSDTRPSDQARTVWSSTDTQLVAPIDTDDSDTQRGLLERWQMLRQRRSQHSLAADA